MIKYSKVIYAPQSEPVTLAEVKVPLKITSSDGGEDDYLLGLIRTARGVAENYCGLSFMLQTRQMKLDAFPSCSTAAIELPFGPIVAMSGTDTASSPNTLGVSYIDDDEATQTLTINTDFRLDSSSGIPRIAPVDDWPTDVDDRINAVTITYTAGNSSAVDVPQEAKDAIKILVAFMYENPDGARGYPQAFYDLLDNIKVYFHARQD
jgi:uncharacterized phiE125 gp8 family phage protein